MFRVVVVYAIAGWVVNEVASTMLPGLNLPAWTVTLVIALVVLGLPIVAIMGWMFDLGPRGADEIGPPCLQRARPGSITGWRARLSRISSKLPSAT